MNSDSDDKQLIFTSDKPALEDKLGAHKHLASLLVQIVKSKSDNPLVVGLFGGWGTGKSSVAKMYHNLSLQNQIKDLYLDAWGIVKAKERFGASFLKEMAKELLDENESKKVIEAVDQRYERWNTIFDLGKFTWLMLGVVLLIFLGTVFIGLALVGLVDKPEFDLLIFMITTVVVNGLLNWVLPKIMVTYESRTVDESYNKIEHFQYCFGEITKKTKYELISVVIDNLDRVEPSDALEVIRMLKTFVDENILNNKRLILILPCDEQELAKHIQKELYIDDAHEFLRKFFNISILVPELIHEDIVAFTKNELDNVTGSLFPSITEEDVSAVSFIISRASRRSPRQVKILINSFIGYWQSAGLANTAGRANGISPLGAVIYICLSYLGKGKQLPSKFSDVFHEFAKGESDAFKEFLGSIQSFQQYISELEWLYLRKLQISDHERVVPNFVDIYFAITDLNWSALDSLIVDNNNLGSLVSRLDLKVREGDGVTKARFMRWVLSLVAGKKITISYIPTPLKADINNLFLRSLAEWPIEWSTEWLSLIDEGLAEYIIQSPIPQSQVVKLLDSLKEKIEKAKAADSEIRFVTRLIESTKEKYWTNTSQHDNLTVALDGVVFHCISQNDNEFSKMLLRNIHAVHSANTAYKLTDNLLARFQNDSVGDLVVDNIFHNMFHNVRLDLGIIAFAVSWLIKVDFSKKINQKMFTVTLECLEYLYKFEDVSMIKNNFSNQEPFSRTVASLESYFLYQEHGNINVIYCIVIISLLTEKIGLSTPSIVARNSLKDKLFPNLVTLYPRLSSEDKAKFSGYLDEHPKIINYFQPITLARLAQYDGLNILSHLDENQSQVVVFRELIKLPHFGKAFNLWVIEKSMQSKNLKNVTEVVRVVFQIIEQIAPPASKYDEILDGLKLLHKNIEVIAIMKKHILWLIERTVANDKNSINITVDKLIVLQKIVPFDDEIKNKLRGKLDGDIISLLSDSSRVWIKQNLE